MVKLWPTCVLVSKLIVNLYGMCIGHINQFLKEIKCVFCHMSDRFNWKHSNDYTSKNVYSLDVARVGGIIDRITFNVHYFFVEVTYQDLFIFIFHPGVHYHQITVIKTLEKNAIIVILFDLECFIMMNTVAVTWCTAVYM